MSPAVTFNVTGGHVFASFRTLRRPHRSRTERFPGFSSVSNTPSFPKRTKSHLFVLFKHTTVPISSHRLPHPPHFPRILRTITTPPSSVLSSPVQSSTFSYIFVDNQNEAVPILHVFASFRTLQRPHRSRTERFPTFSFFSNTPPSPSSHRLPHPPRFPTFLWTTTTSPSPSSHRRPHSPRFPTVLWIITTPPPPSSTFLPLFVPFGDPIVLEPNDFLGFCTFQRRHRSRTE